MENVKISNKKNVLFINKVRNMSDDEFSKFKEDFQNGNFRNTGDNVHQNPIHKYHIHSTTNH